MTWRTATKSLYAIGGGPAKRIEFWPPSASGAENSGALTRAGHLGMMTCANVKFSWLWTITPLGVGWCEGRIADPSLKLAPPIDREAVLRRLTLGMDEALSAVAQLTVKQRDVMTFVACGLTSREIGDLLKISQSTAEDHRAVLMRHLGCERATEVAVLAAKAGLV